LTGETKFKVNVTVRMIPIKISDRRLLEPLSSLKFEFEIYIPNPTRYYKHTYLDFPIFDASNMVVIPYGTTW